MPSRRYSDCATATGSERAGSGGDGGRAMLQHYGGEGCRSMDQATRRRIVTKAIPAECAVLGRSVGGGGRAVSPRKGEITRDSSAWRPGSAPEFHFDG